MTQDLIDLQNRLEQNTTELTTQLLFRDSPVLFLGAIDQDQSNTNTEQVEHQKSFPKDRTPPVIINYDTHRQLLPRTKKKYEIMKDPAFLSSPLYPPTLPSKLSLFTKRDDHLIPSSSHDRFTSKSQLTSLYMYATDYISILYNKNQDFFSHPSPPRTCLHTNTGLKIV